MYSNETNLLCAWPRQMVWSRKQRRNLVNCLFDELSRAVLLNRLFLYKMLFNELSLNEMLLNELLLDAMLLNELLLGNMWFNQLSLDKLTFDELTFDEWSQRWHNILNRQLKSAGHSAGPREFKSPKKVKLFLFSFQITFRSVLWWYFYKLDADGSRTE